MADATALEEAPKFNSPYDAMAIVIIGVAFQLGVEAWNYSKIYSNEGYKDLAERAKNKAKQVK